MPCERGGGGLRECVITPCHPQYVSLRSPFRSVHGMLDLFHLGGRLKVSFREMDLLWSTEL